MPDNRKNVFVSHIHEDDSRLDELIDLLASHGCEMRDGSVNSDKPNNATSESYIKSEILAPRIQWAGAMIVLVSPGTKDSEWVNWEIEYAHRLGKPIIGVWDHGAAECDLPENLETYHDAIVGWQGERILDALDGKVVESDNPDGTPRPIRAIPRHICR